MNTTLSLGGAVRKETRIKGISVPIHFLYTESDFLSRFGSFKVISLFSRVAKHDRDAVLSVYGHDDPHYVRTTTSPESPAVVRLTPSWRIPRLTLAVTLPSLLSGVPQRPVPKYSSLRSFSTQRSRTMVWPPTSGLRIASTERDRDGLMVACLVVLRSIHGTTGFRVLYCQTKGGGGSSSLGRRKEIKILRDIIPAYYDSSDPVRRSLARVSRGSKFEGQGFDRKSQTGEDHTVPEANESVIVNILRVYLETLLFVNMVPVRENPRLRTRLNPNRRDEDEDERGGQSSDRCLRVVDDSDKESALSTRNMKKIESTEFFVKNSGGNQCPTIWKLQVCSCAGKRFDQTHERCGVSPPRFCCTLPKWSFAEKSVRLRSSWVRGVLEWSGKSIESGGIVVNRIKRMQAICSCDHQILAEPGPSIVAYSHAPRRPALQTGSTGTPPPKRNEKDELSADEVSTTLVQTEERPFLLHSSTLLCLFRTWQ
ncbi:hypothetical protein F5I97DRAFT_1831162 [Phlebopus sp. FC_14]|nr:hypothetical protein F5I97DRAFT_1831162 [Phlebopus sp. FC_14]